MSVDKPNSWKQFGHRYPKKYTMDRAERIALFVQDIEELIALDEQTNPLADPSSECEGKDHAAFRALRRANDLVNSLAGWAIEHQIGLALENKGFVPLHPSKTKNLPDYLAAKIEVDNHRHEAAGHESIKAVLDEEFHRRDSRQCVGSFIDRLDDVDDALHALGGCGDQQAVRGNRYHRHGAGGHVLTAGPELLDDRFQLFGNVLRRGVLERKNSHHFFRLRLVEHLEQLLDRLQVLLAAIDDETAAGSGLDIDRVSDIELYGLKIGGGSIARLPVSLRQHAAHRLSLVAVALGEGGPAGPNNTQQYD